MAQFGTWFPETLEACCKRQTNKWYVDYHSWKCIQDCVGPNCGGLAKGWDLTYQSNEKRCHKCMSWDFNTCMELVDVDDVWTF
jgi:hypothetical protein